MPEKILVVDDERPIADILRFTLERENFEVLTASSGQEALDLAIGEDPNLVILDIMLPGLDGFAVCEKMREHTGAPIIMLTARDEEGDKVMGLELGADDYVTKPFSPQEVIARVKAQLRRASGAMTDSERIRCGGFVIDLNRQAVVRGTETIDLTQREFALLKFLAQHAGRVFSREDLLERVWEYEYHGDIRTVDVTVRRLREKIEEDPSEPNYILTKRGVGYYLEPNGAAS